MAGKIQNEDVKSASDLTGAGGSAAQLINDTKIYVTADGINDTLANAITNNQIGGASGSPWAYKSVTSTYSVLTTDETMKLSGASFTITLPTAVGVAGKRYQMLHAGTSISQVYTINTTSSQTVGGIASGSYALYTNSEVLFLESDGANWIIIHHYATTPWADSGATTITAVTGGSPVNPTKSSTVTLDKHWWRRSATDMFGRIEFAQSNGTSGTTGTGLYAFKIAGTSTIDTSAITVYTGTSNASFNNIVGFGGAASGSNNIQGAVIVYDTTNLRLLALNIAGANESFVGASTIPLNSQAAYAFEYRVPISGWRP